MLFCLFLVTLLATPSPAEQDTLRPQNLIVMIADGFGPSTAVLGREVGGEPLALDSLLRGAVKTSSASRRITDSAAGAVAYSAGINTTNRYIGVDTLGNPVGTLLEGAEAKGMATGVISTSRITDATPAAFYAHSVSRYAENRIAAQLLTRGIEVILGGGQQHFAPKGSGGEREDGRNLIAEAEAMGYTVATTPEALAAASFPVLGLFAPDMMDMEIDRGAAEPSLVAMTQRALDLLGGAPEGFVLVIETEGTDEAGHYNDPAALAREVLSYDAAVALALDFARRDSSTLVVSLADHETGGLSVGRATGYETRLPYLRRVKASARRMIELLEEGMPIEDVLRDYAGIESLTEDEQERLYTAWLGNRPDTRARAAWVRGQMRATPGRGQLTARTLADLMSRRAHVGWTTRGHTAVDVGLYAWGPGAERFGGVMENVAVGRALADLLGLDLAAITAQLQDENADATP